MANRIEGDVIVTGQLVATTMTVPASAVTNASVAADADIARSKIGQDTLAKFVIPWEAFRVWDAYATNLPGTSATDDLGLIGGTFGTNSPTIQTSDLKAAGATTRYARFSVALPPEYDDGETVQLRVHCGAKTTVADTSMTIDVECYESDKEEGISADLCTTAATSCNSLTLADKDFTITPTSLASGDVLDIRLTMAVNDAASGTAVIGIIGSVELLCDIRG